MADPRQGPFHNPPLWHDDEFVQLVAFDDLDDPTACAGCSRCDARPLIAGIGEDAFDEWEQRARVLVEHQTRTVAILDIGGVDGDAQQEAERVDQNVPLAALDLLARVVA